MGVYVFYVGTFWIPTARCYISQLKLDVQYMKVWTTAWFDLLIQHAKTTQLNYMKTENNEKTYLTSTQHIDIICLTTSTDFSHTVTYKVMH